MRSLVPIKDNEVIIITGAENHICIVLHCREREREREILMYYKRIQYVQKITLFYFCKKYFQAEFVM